MNKKRPQSRSTGSQRRLDAAIEYLRNGLPITLCTSKTKKPLGIGWSANGRGKNWRKQRWTKKEVRRAFRVLGDCNVGIQLGPESGVIDIEEDSREARDDWLTLFDGCNRPKTPKFSSKLGTHRLYKWDEMLETIEKAVIHFKRLEIRLGGGGKATQSLLPPSRTDRVTRQWLVSLDDRDVAPLPKQVLRRIVEASQTAGKHAHSRHKPFAVGTGTTASARSTVSTAYLGSAVTSVSPVPIEFQETIELAIANTLPMETGQRNRMIFEFARHLKAIPALADADVQALKQFVKRWHKAALPMIGTKPFTETWLDFANAWKAVVYPAGQGPIAMIYKQSLADDLPALAEQYPERKLRRLVALCFALQRESKDRPFFLACRTAGALLGVPHGKANRWLRILVLDKVLKLESVGTRHRASEYRYVAVE